MANSTSVIFKTMNLLFWIIFIGLCVKAGSILFSFIFSISVYPEAVTNLYTGVDLSALYRFNIVDYAVIALALAILTGLKAYIGFCVVRIFIELKLDKPFSEGINIIISRISRVALIAAVLAIIAQAYSDWLLARNVTVPIDWGYAEILFFAGVIYIIALVFRKGIELQSENDLTV